MKSENKLKLQLSHIENVADSTQNVGIQLGYDVDTKVEYPEVNFCCDFVFF